ncbi:MAG: carbon-nitrogen hydrolase family protein [Psychrilyobacter sp.]|uniref:carbon-nitrogen hydrolase family protein n=1 Tax=Psychrilyobacter sp. TaxID=2586924 RepID=UPI003C72E887
MKISYYQMDIIFKDIEANIKKVKNSLKKLDTEMLILPELFNTGYMYPSKNDIQPYTEQIPQGKTTKALENLAKENNTFIIGGIAEVEGEYIYNTIVVVGPNGYIGKYRKIHLTKLEKKIFASGNEIKVFDILNHKIGFSICYDIWFPEHSRIMAVKGVELVCHPSNFGGKDSLDFSRIRALENNVFIVTCNRVGNEKGNDFDAHFRGESQVVSPKGEILKQSNDKEDIVTLNLDLSESNQKSGPMTEDLIKEYSIYKTPKINK